jgi:hypothetical protein
MLKTSLSLLSALTLSVLTLPAHAGGGGSWYAYPVLEDTLRNNDYVCKDQSHTQERTLIDCTRDKSPTIHVTVRTDGDTEKGVETRGISVSALGQLFKARGYTCEEGSKWLCRNNKLEKLGLPKVGLGEISSGLIKLEVSSGFWNP